MVQAYVVSVTRTYHPYEKRLHRVKTRQRNQRFIREALIDYGDGENC